jgi:hypothetical protein
MHSYAGVLPHYLRRAIPIRSITPEARPIIAQGNALGPQDRFDPERRRRDLCMIVLSIQFYLLGRAYSARTTVSWRSPRALPWAMIGRTFSAH